MTKTTRTVTIQFDGDAQDDLESILKYVSFKLERRDSDFSLTECNYSGSDEQIQALVLFALGKFADFAELIVKDPTDFSALAREVFGLDPSAQYNPPKFGPEMSIRRRKP